MTAPRLSLASGFLALCLLLAPGFGTAIATSQEVAQAPASQHQLADFAGHTGLRDVWAFVEMVTSLRASGRLPARFVTKDAARARGWRGGGLCDVWPGHVIGGDTFHNFDLQLPAGQRYFESDLDGDCEQRGPSRLVYSAEGLIFVTTDHYHTFARVP
jgi:hypothetical protein